MAKELKLWPDDEEAVKNELAKHGAMLTAATDSVHKYFNQPESLVLKLVKRNGETTLDKLRKQGQQFLLVSKELVDDAESLDIELTKKYGSSQCLSCTQGSTHLTIIK